MDAYRLDCHKASCGFGLIVQMDDRASHWLVRTAIGSLSRLTHRGAVAADGKSGDGCGLLIKTPEAFLRAVAEEQGIYLREVFATGMVFLDRDPGMAATARRCLAEDLVNEGLEVAGWRPVPVDVGALGAQALRSMPRIEQLFVNAPPQMDREAFERHLYIARRRVRKALKDRDHSFHVASLSARAILYKGLVMPHKLPALYPDLGDPRLASSLCIFHQRFSTNTWPEWRLAQPFRFLAHNGELNTIQGNRNWSEGRAVKFKTPLIPHLEEIRPWVSSSGSDSFSLDNMLEALVIGGMDLIPAIRILIPPAWHKDPDMDPDLRAFYEYHSMHMEPWDGPASIALTDGRYAACVTDRNGLRPARYMITKDRHITVASEIGVWDCPSERVLRKGRLKPGQMLAVDTASGRLLLSEDIDEALRRRAPYRAWLGRHAQRLSTRDDDEQRGPVMSLCADRAVYEKLFQLSFEERDQVLRVLGESGAEAIGSMGDDIPLPVLSHQVRSLYDSFRQQFAQVTNPPIDPLREHIVMSLATCFGKEQNLFDESPEHARRLTVASPVLSTSVFRQLLEQGEPHYAAEHIDLNYPGGKGLRRALDAICAQAAAAVRAGKTLLVLSDRHIHRERLPIHALLATGAVHHCLIASGLRCDANIIVETATARDAHHVAALIGFGATAVYPYLAYSALQAMTPSGGLSDRTVGAVLRRYRHGIDKGLYKILSKMGISTVASYRGAQLFEPIGLHREVVQRCFTGSPCRVQGAGFDELEQDQRILAREAWRPGRAPPQGGLLKYVSGSEYHAFNPDVIGTLHDAVRSGAYNDYRRYAEWVNRRPPTKLRDLLRLRLAAKPLALEQVEPEAAILARFETGAMSLGALSPEAHEALAMAMNRLGGRSNSGEGGEDATRFGTDRMSRIKQVASGRFGVTPHYLVNAEVLQIKVAQGAKPGEGGQLAGTKVNALIARLRHASPGTTLISPPPHHDIYSIEDLAQLIFDLKQVNPQSRVSVKLVSEAGVGTIAAGVAKAYADQITISGHDGGTGASPLSSLRYAGSPWELGLAETHQILRANDLRDHVRLQVDGGLKSGLDVVKAAILGAESFGFGTVALVALGCKYLRICHKNNCATGVATQHEQLRARHFKGDAGRVMTLFRCIARETREWLARLGVRCLDELVGRLDLLEPAEGATPRQRRLDLGPILSTHGASSDKPQRCARVSNDSFDKGLLAERMVRDALPAIRGKAGGEYHYAIRNDNRSIGARLSGEIARRYGDQGMESTPLVLRLKGTAGQSLGVWNAGGLHIYLEGDANDYVGKGMASGRIVIRPPREAGFASQDNVICGNTCLYGATGGSVFISGIAGERFAVRNSGAHAVVEGTGDHCCEYMTGGVVTVLGPTGLNFGAGMTGGFAFVLDLEGRFASRYNSELVDIHRMGAGTLRAHGDYLHGIISEHVAQTASPWGRTLREGFAAYLGRFWLVKPKHMGLQNLIDRMHHAA